MYAQFIVFLDTICFQEIINGFLNKFQCRCVKRRPIRKISYDEKSNPILCVFVVALVFVQQGKGSDVGASFGAGSSNTMFGAGGSFSFLFKLTAFVVFLFFASSLSLNYWFAKQEVSSAPSAQVKNNPQVPNVPGQVPG